MSSAQLVVQAWENPKDREARRLKSLIDGVVPSARSSNARAKINGSVLGAGDIGGPDLGVGESEVLPPTRVVSKGWRVEEGLNGRAEPLHVVGEKPEPATRSVPVGEKQTTQLLRTIGENTFEVAEAKGAEFLGKKGLSKSGGNFVVAPP